MHSNNSNPFFIVGAQRSGTTLLRLMLNAHSQVAIPEEGTFWMPLLRRVKRRKSLEMSGKDLEFFVNYLEKNAQLALWGEDFSGVHTQMKSLENIVPEAMIDSYYSHYAQLNGKTRWGDKTPSFFRMIPVISRLFPKAKFIHITRDGRDLFLSWRKMDPTKSNVAVVALEWLFKVTKAKKDLSALGQEYYLEVRYEDLVADPKSTLQNICVFLGLEFEHEILNYWQHSDQFIGEHHSELIFKPPSRDSTGKWKKGLKDKEIALFESIAGDCLGHYHYELASKNYKALRTRLQAWLMLLWGLPFRAFQVAFTALNLALSAKLGLSTTASGAGEAPKDAEKKARAKSC